MEHEPGNLAACGDLGEVQVKGFGTQHIYSLEAEASGRFR